MIDSGIYNTIILAKKDFQKKKENMRVSARACINTNIWHFNASYSQVELHKKQITLSEHCCGLSVN